MDGQGEEQQQPHGQLEGKDQQGERAQAIALQLEHGHQVGGVVGHGRGQQLVPARRLPEVAHAQVGTALQQLSANII